MHELDIFILFSSPLVILGGAYMPLDVSYPHTLLDSILSDSTPVAVLTIKELEPNLAGILLSMIGIYFGRGGPK